MIQRQLKLKLTVKQERELNQWLWHLTGVWNWAVRKIEMDAKDRIYYSKITFKNLLSNHSQKLGIPSHVLQGTLVTAHNSWDRCFKKIARRPRLKGIRNKLNSIPFPDPIKISTKNRLYLPNIKSIKFYKQNIPEGKIKSGRLIKRPSGWYLCIFIDAKPNNIIKTGDGMVGIDPGFNDLLTLSSGEKVKHGREIEKIMLRLGQAQRGNKKRLVAKIHERILNKRKDRNHKISRKLVSENALIVFSKDNIKGMAKLFGKSVGSSAHAQLRSMLAYKCRTGDRRYIEVNSRNSTRICSACGSLTGPAGFAGLKVRQWVCADCGTEHDRDVNAAINTLIVGAGCAHENRCEAVSETVVNL